MRGTGWHRCVYILFEHNTPIDFDLKNGKDFSSRSVKFSSIYEKNKQSLMPVGLSFFQTEWDLSVKNVFYNHFGNLIKNFKEFIS